MGVTLEALATHGLHDAQVVEIGSIDLGAVDPAVRDDLIAYVVEIDELSELDGKAAPAWWRDGGAPPDHLSDLADPGADFGQATTRAMRRLADVSPSNATNGLILFFRGKRDDGTALAGCAKVRFEPLERLWFTGRTTPLEAIERLNRSEVLKLPKDVLKATTIPNPSGNGELRVVDNQLRDPASYWLAVPRGPGASTREGDDQEGRGGADGRAPVQDHDERRGRRRRGGQPAGEPVGGRRAGHTGRLRGGGRAGRRHRSGRPVGGDARRGR